MTHREALIPVAVGLAALGLAALAEAGPVRIDRVSQKSFDETLRQLEWGFGGYGLTVVAQLDYQQVLEKIGVRTRRSRMIEVMRRPWARAGGRVP